MSPSESGRLVHGPLPFTGLRVALVRSRTCDGSADAGGRSRTSGLSKLHEIVFRTDRLQCAPAFRARRCKGPASACRKSAKSTSRSARQMPPVFGAPSSPTSSRAMVSWGKLAVQIGNIAVNIGSARLVRPQNYRFRSARPSSVLFSVVGNHIFR